jgi:hypothetical protein
LGATHAACNIVKCFPHTEQNLFKPTAPHGRPPCLSLHVPWRSPRTRRWSAPSAAIVTPSPRSASTPTCASSSQARWTTSSWSGTSSRSCAPSDSQGTRFEEGERGRHWRWRQRAGPGAPCATLCATSTRRGRGAYTGTPSSQTPPPQHTPAPAHPCPSTPLCGTRAVTFSRLQAGVYSVTYSPAHPLIASGSKDRTIRLWQPTVWVGRQGRRGLACWFVCS